MPPIARHTAACLLCAALLPAARAEPDRAAVREAAASVHRLWLGLPLPRQFALQAGTGHLPQLDNQGYAEMPLDGLYMRQGKDGSPKPLGGKGTVFRYGGQHYLLLNTGSAYAVSDKGDLLTHARLAEHTGGGEVFFAENGGMRHFGDDNGGKARVFVLTAAAPKLALLPANVRFSDTAADLASVKADGLKSGKALPLADMKFAAAAAPVSAVGMEGRSDQLGGKRGSSDIGTRTYLDAVVAEGLLVRPVRKNKIELWEHTAPFAGSMSGGALLNTCGQVVGMLQAAAKTAPDTGAAVSSADAAHLLKKHHIPFKQASGRCGGAAATAANVVDGAADFVGDVVQRPKQWLSLGALLLGVLFATVTAWKLLKRVWRARRHSSARHTPHREPSAPPRDMPRRDPVPPTRRDTPPAAPKTEFAATAYGGGQAVLRALSGSLHNDISLPVGRTVTLGRDPSNDVVLPSPHISARHLRLTFDGQSVSAEDLNSTNGSFRNGEAFRHSVRLAAGDTLQLTADPTLAVFRVELSAPANPPTQLHAPLAAVLSPQFGGLPEIRLHAGQTLNVGRGSDNDVVIAHPQVSARHCRIGAEADGSVWVEDLSSTNGTFVGNTHRRINGRTRLPNGETLFLANAQTAFRLQNIV